MIVVVIVVVVVVVVMRVVAHLDVLVDLMLLAPPTRGLAQVDAYAVQSEALECVYASRARSVSHISGMGTASAHLGEIC